MPQKIMWKPEPRAAEQSQMATFWRTLESEADVALPTYEALHRFSVEHSEEFWRHWLAASGIEFADDVQPVFVPRKEGESFGGRFFPKLKLNFAQNLLRHRDERPALTGISESRSIQRFTYGQLYDAVSRVRSGLDEAGVRQGDRVAGFLPNCPEAVIAMLAATSLGAVWTSCSPDFGAQGVLERFGQVKPKVLFAANAYVYNGKRFDCRERIEHIAHAIPEIEKIIVVPFVSEQPSALSHTEAVSWEEFQGPPGEIDFLSLPFNHPLYVLYSSGTTGKPKCIVHGAGGTLLQHAKELLLHCDVRPESKIMYFTTCGWMMWNWLVSSLFVGAEVVLYDGSPAYPSMERLWSIAEEHKLTHFGTSPKFIASCRGNVVPNERFNLGALQTLLSTGAPLLPEDFDWIYDNVRQNLLVASISGGTDIISCFMLGNPMLPVYRGEIQCLGLGMDVRAFDEANQPVYGEKGELVCQTPFPSMPIFFWDDPEHQRYRDAYFHKDTETWRHGDYIEITQTQGTAGGVVVYGRSDATLNPGGVRIGTAEIYRLVETLPQITDSIVVGQPHEGDVRVVLFVVLTPGHSWSSELEQHIKQVIRQGATPRHVPAIIVPVEKIPYTLSGKKVELAVRDIICGKEPKNQEALADRTALDGFRSLPQLRT